MAYINIVMSLKDFFRYVEDILEKYNGVFLVAEKNQNDTIDIRNISIGCSEIEIDECRAKNLRFFILSEPVTEISRDYIYDDEIASLVIVGEGGRVTENTIERIYLRVLSKKPHKNTVRILNAIRNKLKKDVEIGIGVQGGSMLHDQYFYQKQLVSKKVFKIDFYNDKAGTLMVKE
ncbi:hypothetical protein EG347_01085 [Chryseobacterium sp. G0186]|uniref:hypothetical protein n=1 Tax=Chryseobacterium sp. G0186 TaxID=2487064 RepID=UPI000F4FE80C|nr:hypothetical protein [Chryseobacterium sp. G0186]AZA76221.1 hypothetical protein EG347_01085 [Chryseobacterium sp. G0186]